MKPVQIDYTTLQPRQHRVKGALRVTACVEIADLEPRVPLREYRRHGARVQLQKALQSGKPVTATKITI
jgi:hypothetical protein